MQQGSRCIFLTFLIFSIFFQFFNEMKNNEKESFLSSVKCRIRTVYFGLVFVTNGFLPKKEQLILGNRGQVSGGSHLWV